MGGLMRPVSPARTYGIVAATLILLVAAAGLVVVAIRPAEGDPALDATELEFLTLLNAYRASNSLPPLEHDPRLTAASDWLANDEANHDYAGNTDTLNRATTKRMQDVIGNPLPYSAIGETVAGGHPNAQGVLDGWKNSPEHDRNLRGDFNAVGVSRVCKANTTYGCYWAANFGMALGPIPTTPAPTDSPSPTPTESPSPAPTESPADTPTETPTASATESTAPTNSPTPTAELLVESAGESPTDTATPDPSASPTDSPTATPVPTEAPGLRRNGESTLRQAIEENGAQIEIVSAGALGLVTGDFIAINRGTATEEFFEITGLDPLTIDPPAALPHTTDEVIQQVARGDADCDGAITGNDVVAALAATAGLAPAARCQSLADSDCDGTTDETDAFWILLRVAELAAFEAAGCSAVGARLPASTMLEVAAAAGAPLIQPLSQQGFHIGDTIRLNPGGPNEEDNVITGIGSFVLQTELLHSHDAGEAIAKVLEVPDYVPQTPTPSPTPIPTESPTESPTPILSPCSTLCEMESPTPAETESPTPTETASPTPTDTPSPSPTESPSPTPTDTPI